MLKTLAWKELRETAGITLAALLAYGGLVIGSTSQTFHFYMLSRVAPFVDDNFLVVFILISVAMTIALGFRQTLGESIRGTYPLFLHRPVTRHCLIGVKLLVGLTLYFVCAAAPLLIYSLWAARPGTHASPFEWWMTELGWALWLCMSVLYGGAFLSGIRPGRWLGTRLWPLIAAGTTCFVLSVLSVASSPWWSTGAILTNAALIAATLHVAQTRDF